MKITQQYRVVHHWKSLILAFFSSLLLIFCTKKESKTDLLDKKRVDSLYHQAALHVNEGKDEKAFYEFNLAKEGYLQHKDSALAARCLTEMAIIQEFNSDYLGSIETSLSALKLIHENRKEHAELQYDNYVNLGTNSSSLKNYSEAKKLYLKSLKFAKTQYQKIKSEHNLAVIYYSVKDYKKAKDLEEMVVKNLPKGNEKYYKAVINYNRYLWHLKPEVNPTLEFDRAAAHYQSINDNWGLAATYLYLSEYYNVKNQDSSIVYAKKLLNISKKLNSPFDQLEALEKIIKLEKKPRPYFTEYTRITDSLYHHINQSKNQFAIIRYDSEKNLKENLQLEQDLTQKNYILYFSIGLLLISTIGGYIWISNRKKKLKLIAENEIKESKLYTSKKIHDVVANGLYQVMTALEHKKEMNKELLLEKLEEMYQKSRDISYDKHMTLTPNYIKEQMSEIGETFQNQNLQVFMIGNEAELWRQVPINIHHDLYIIIQELFINTKKHSDSTRIVLRFEIKNKEFVISYHDNGSCHSIANIEVGNGIKNIQERVERHLGKIIYPDTNKLNSGFRIMITLPILKYVS